MNSTPSSSRPQVSSTEELEMEQALGIAPEPKKLSVEENNALVADEALRLVLEGFSVIPVYQAVDGVCTCQKGAECTHAGKHPIGGTKRVYNEPEVVNQWRSRKLPINLGLCPEKDLIVLDFDGDPGVRFLERLLAWCPELQPDKGKYAFFRSGGGGYHLVGRGSARCGTQIHGIQGFDVRGERGMVVVEPSLYAKGGEYKALVPLTTGVAEFPDKIVLLARGKLPFIDLRKIKPSRVVTIDDLRGMKRWKTVMGLVAKGKSFAEPDSKTRNQTMFEICKSIARRYPDCDPKAVAAIFRPSLEAMLEEAPDAPTPELMAERLDYCIEQNSERDKNLVQVSTNIEEMAEKVMAEVWKAPEDANNDEGEYALFDHGGVLCTVNTSRGLTEMLEEGEGSPAIKLVNVSGMRGILSGAAQWVNKDNSPVMCPHEVASYICDVVQGPQERWRAPPLTAVVDGAFLRPNGSICAGGIYDEKTGIYSARRSALAAKGELMERDEAVDLLQDVFDDFPIEDEYQGVLPASVLTGVGRFAFKGPSPLFLIDANVRGAGKTLAARAAGFIIARGGAIGTALGDDAEEDRKQITSLAMSGAQVVLIDNVTGTLGTSKLCEALTLHDGVWSDRVLGRNEMWRGDFRPTWFGTGNNIELHSDMVRRVVWCRLNSKEERPEYRDFSQFTHPSLLTYVLENRDRLYWAALSILKRYMDIGMPQPDTKTLGGYEGWSKFVRGAVMWCGYADPLASTAMDVLADRDYMSGSGLVEGILLVQTKLGKPRIRAQEIVDEVNDMVDNTVKEVAKGLGMDGEDPYAELRQILLDFRGPRTKTESIQATTVGRALRKYRGRTFGKYRLKQSGTRGLYWNVEEVGA